MFFFVYFYPVLGSLAAGGGVVYPPQVGVHHVLPLQAEDEVEVDVGVGAAVVPAGGTVLGTWGYFLDARVAVCRRILNWL